MYLQGRETTAETELLLLLYHLFGATDIAVANYGDILCCGCGCGVVFHL